MIQIYSRASFSSTGTWANCTNATVTAIINANPKDKIVSGMVTVSPGSKIVPKEFIKMRAKRSVIAFPFPVSF